MDTKNLISELDLSNIKKLIDLENESYNSIIIKSNNNNNNLLYINYLLKNIFNCNLDEFYPLKLDKTFELNYKSTNDNYNLAIYEHENIYFLDFNKIKYSDYPMLFKILDYLIQNENSIKTIKNIIIINNIDFIIKNYVSNINNYLEKYYKTTMMIIFSSNINKIYFKKTKFLCFNYRLNNDTNYILDYEKKLIKNLILDLLNKLKQNLVNDIKLCFDDNNILENNTHLDNTPNKIYYLKYLKNNFNVLDISNLIYNLNYLEKNIEQYFNIIYILINDIYDFINKDIVKLYLIVEKFILLDMIYVTKTNKINIKKIKDYFKTKYNLSLVNTSNKFNKNNSNNSKYKLKLLSNIIIQIPFYKIIYNKLKIILNLPFINKSLNEFVNHLLSFNYSLLTIIKNIQQLIIFINNNGLKNEYLYFNENSKLLKMYNIIGELDIFINDTQKENIILQQFILELYELYNF